MRNPTDDIDISFSNYLNERNTRLEKHMEGGVPDYAFAGDYATRQKLHSFPGFFKIGKILTSQYVPQIMQQMNMNAARVGPNQFPKIYEMTRHCAELLGIGMPTVFVTNSPGDLNAYTVAVEDATPIIVIYSSMLERMTPEEILDTIGHECGHIHNNHGLYNTIATLLFELTTAIPGVSQIAGLLTAPMRLAMMAWSRAAEVTADRAGLLCSGNLDAFSTCMAKFSAGAMLTNSGLGEDNVLNVDALVEQYERVRDNPVRISEFVYDHPINARRILAGREFVKSEVFYKWHPELKEPDMHLYTKQELDDICKQFVNVSGTGKQIK